MVERDGSCDTVGGNPDARVRRAGDDGGGGGVGRLGTDSNCTQRYRGRPVYWCSTRHSIRLQISDGGTSTRRFSDLVVVSVKLVNINYVKAHKPESSSATSARTRVRTLNLVTLAPTPPTSTTSVFRRRIRRPKFCVRFMSSSSSSSAGASAACV